MLSIYLGVMIVNCVLVQCLKVCIVDKGMKILQMSIEFIKESPCSVVDDFCKTLLWFYSGL